MAASIPRIAVTIMISIRVNPSLDKNFAFVFFDSIFYQKSKSHHFFLLGEVAAFMFETVVLFSGDVVVNYRSCRTFSITVISAGNHKRSACYCCS